MSETLPATTDDRYVVAALDRGLELLEQLAERPDSGVSDLARHAGSTKSQAFRILRTLEARGYVRKDPETRTYALGYRPLFLAEHVERQAILLRSARPHMRALARQTGENVHLIARDGLDSICIALEESDQPLRLYASVGRRGPLHAGGGSTVLLAHASEEVRAAVLAEPLETYTPKTITDPDRLRALLHSVRERGWHEADEDVDPGAYALSVPIHDHAGAVVAALSVAGPKSRLTDAARELHLEALRRAGSLISQDMGWTTSPTDHGSGQRGTRAPRRP